MNLLLYGSGNAVVMPHTWEGMLQSLEPISASRVTFDGGYRDYKILIDGKPKNPANLLHFTYNPDPEKLWKGQGVNITLKDIVEFERQQMAHKVYRYIILGDERDLDLAGLLQYGPLKRVSTEEIFGY